MVKLVWRTLMASSPTNEMLHNLGSKSDGVEQPRASATGQGWCQFRTASELGTKWHG